MKIDDLLREADSIIEKKASKNEPKVPVASSSDEVTKIAELLLQADETMQEELNKKASAPVEVNANAENDLHVKIASALVITEVLNNVEKFEKIAQFEEKAKAAGHSQMEIDKFIVEKFL
jgi:hypothetical protein